MARNKSVDPDKTSEALRRALELARSKGVVNIVTRVGDFQESAIETAIKRGRISERMIRAFETIGVKREYLTGEVDMPADDPIINENESLQEIVPSDEDSERVLGYLYDIAKVTKDATIKRRVATIKLEAAKLLHDLWPWPVTYEHFLTNLPTMGPELIKAIADNTVINEDDED